MSERKLTEMQEKFLDAYFGEANFNVKAAAEIAGYAPSTVNKIMPALKDEVLARTELLLAQAAPQAATRLTEIVSDKDAAAAIGANLRMLAAEKILDRVGISKTERLKVDAGNAQAIFIMPAKAPVVVENETAE